MTKERIGSGNILEDAPTQERAAGPTHTDVKLVEEGFLPDDFVRQLMNIGEIDLLIGLPTYNNAKTIGAVVAAIQAGLLQSFPRDRAAIINADAGSRDGTPDLVTRASIDDVRKRDSNRFALRTLHAVSTKYASSVARGTAFRTILTAGDLLRSRATAMISPESAHIKAEWLPSLFKPVTKENFDLVLPTYSRHKFDGLLITNLLYPLIRALYGVRIREPYALDFAFSNGLGSQFLAQCNWSGDGIGAGCEVRFVVAAISSGFRIAQTFLGVRPHMDRHAADLVPALRQTVGSVFWAMEPDYSVWSSKTGSEPIRTVGAEQEFTTGPQRINRKRLLENFQSGIAELESVFRSILSPSTLAELRAVSNLPESEFRYPAELWVKTIYEFAAAHHRSVISRDHIIQALAPLFRGRALAFLLENRASSPSGTESSIEDLCLEFERLKPYLLEIWAVQK